MKYYYKKPEIYSAIYGQPMILDDPIYKMGTLFLQDGKGLIVVQKRFIAKYVYWDSIDPWLANDIYLNEHFPMYFKKNARKENYSIIPVRKVMWALRMKPLPKEYGEDYI